MYPAVAPVTSPDGVHIACWYSEDVLKPKWRVVVLSINGGGPVTQFEMAPSVYPDTALRWTPDGRGITYIDNNGGAANLWVQPVDGGTPKQLTSFSWGQIYSFDWAHDGRLAYSRGLSTSDVVILRDVPRKK
jgi:Tol biopolymer transport system component